eukprot:2085501-Amphidinium_carterae.1
MEDEQSLCQEHTNGRKTVRSEWARARTTVGAPERSRIAWISVSLLVVQSSWHQWYHATRRAPSSVE